MTEADGFKLALGLIAFIQLVVLFAQLRLFRIDSTSRDLLERIESIEKVAKDIRSALQSQRTEQGGNG